MVKWFEVQKANDVGGYSKFLVLENDQNQTLIYFNCPKNANSSGKLFFVQHLGLSKEFAFLSDDIPEYQQIEKIKAGNDPYDGKKKLINFMPSKQPFVRFGEEIDFKICFTREPISRFVSAYQNRILWHKDKNFSGLSFDDILDRLLEGDFSNAHFRPQTDFLGHDLNYYNLACDISETKKFESFVNEFFKNRNVSFPHLQKKGLKSDIELTPDRVKKIRKIYESDFQLLKITSY